MCIGWEPLTGKKRGSGNGLMELVASKIHLLGISGKGLRTKKILRTKIAPSWTPGFTACVIKSACSDMLLSVSSKKNPGLQSNRKLERD